VRFAETFAIPPSGIVAHDLVSEVRLLIAAGGGLARSRRKSLASRALSWLVAAAGMVGCGPGADAGTGSEAVRRAEATASASPVVVAAAVEDARAAARGRRAAPPAEESAREALGRRMFFDPRLSNPPGTSCASCHDPARAFSGNNGATVGVARGSRTGHLSHRNTPSVLYVTYVPAFHFALEDDDDLVPSPFGGLGWGGRADSVAEFVRLPLFDPDEMNNRSDADVAAKLASAPYAGEIAREYPGALGTVAGAVGALAQALQAFLTGPAMAPFTSKYDDYLRHTATLTPLEMRGLERFKSPDKGACDACHLLEDSSNRPSRSMFTDYGYDGLAVPRNVAIPANRDPAHHDLGLCERKDARVPSSDARFCAKFRTPSLRNVAVRERFMHNGQFTKLRDVVAFYATRSTSPAIWYPQGAKYDDVPARYRDNINVASLPYNRREGVEPAYADADVDAIVAFLETLTDAPYRDGAARDGAARDGAARDGAAH
jgi:cytochrome c peroxidase